MATYILFWNPAISSFTMEYFLKTFKHGVYSGNWSFHEYEDVDAYDTFYMVRCGEGKTGIVMQGVIQSPCYEDLDWSPKNRKPIFYADIESSVIVNPDEASVMLTPEILTEKLPDFNWFGGHSGRVLSDVYAEKLNEIWLEYIDSNPALFAKKQAKINKYMGLHLTDEMKEIAFKKTGNICEVCGYDYNAIFPNIKDAPGMTLHPVVAANLSRLIYAVCPSCCRVPDAQLAKKLKGK